MSPLTALRAEGGHLRDRVAVYGNKMVVFDREGCARAAYVSLPNTKANSS